MLQLCSGSALTVCKGLFLLSYTIGLIPKLSHWLPRSVSNFFSLMTLGLLYKLAILYSTLSQQKTIQVFGMCLSSITLCIYNATQYQRLKQPVDVLTENDAIREDTWPVIRGIALSIIAVTTALLYGCFCFSGNCRRNLLGLRFAKSRPTRKCAVDSDIFRYLLLHRASSQCTLTERRALTFIASITILVSVSTIGMTWLCYRNFRRGL